MAHSRLSGQTRWRYYVCTGYHNKGASVCANGVPLPMREADDAVSTAIRANVLQPEIIEGAIADAVEALRPQAGTVDAQRADLQAQLAAVEDELARLAEAIAVREPAGGAEGAGKPAGAPSAADR